VRDRGWTVDHICAGSLVDGDDDGWRPIGVRLLWSLADPIAVTLVFGRNKRWTIARDLLADGMLMAVGEGDAQLRPYEGGEEDYYGDVWLDLCSQSGYARILLDGDMVSEFLAQTCNHVALGAERVDLTQNEIKWLKSWGVTWMGVTT
jgi:hypothetical protein